MSSPASPRRTPRSRRSPAAGKRGRRDAVDTPTKVLDAAEAIFIDVGFAATSHRAVASRAGVNLAAAHYHFGSKEGLLGAVVHRRVAPISALRDVALDRLLAEPTPPSVEQVVEAFLSPLSDSEVGPELPSLIARLYGEPESIAKPLLEREFGDTAKRFVHALGLALPDVAEEEVAWRFHFVIGAMIHVLAFDRPPRVGASARERDEGLDRLVPFVAAGLRHGTGAAAEPVPPSETRR